MKINSKFMQVLGCVGNVKGLTDHSAARLQDCNSALAF